MLVAGNVAQTVCQGGQSRPWRSIMAGRQTSQAAMQIRPAHVKRPIPEPSAID